MWIIYLAAFVYILKTTLPWMRRVAPHVKPLTIGIAGIVFWLAVWVVGALAVSSLLTAGS